MYELKTKSTEVEVDDFLDAVPNPERQEDGRKLREMMERLSGYPAKMWGPTMVGFGRYHYRYASGHEGDMPRIAFSPRDRELVLYLCSGFPRYQELMDRLGKYKTSKACTYVKRLSDIDESALEELIVESLDEMREKYPDHV